MRAGSPIWIGLQAYATKVRRRHGHQVSYQAQDTDELVLISTFHVNQVGQLASAGIAGEVLGEQREEPCVVAIRR
jgi:hypothetical protein